MGYRYIDKTVIRQMRKLKKDGISLLEISRIYGVAKSTVSLYTRDLFYDSRRRYPTREIALKAVSWKDGSTCPDCGGITSKNHVRCINCYFKNRQKNDNPDCIYCGGRTIHAGIRFTQTGLYQRHQCVKCGKHMKGYGAKQHFDIDTINNLTKSLPNEIRDDVRQDIALKCWELGINMNQTDKVQKVVNQCVKDKKKDSNKRLFQEVSIHKKITSNGDLEIADILADPNADFIKELEDKYNA